MKMIKNPLFILLLLCFSQNLKAQYIQVDDTYTAQRLVEDVLIDSDCARISNISVTGHNFGDGLSYGYFDAGTSTFPFAKGVILSTGKATSAKGPNNSILSEGPRSWVGDQDLELALGIGGSSVNATVLEFDFQPLARKVSFDYIFASEQYLTNPSPGQCSFTDGFVFLIKEVGSSDPYKNLAVIPGTTTPVLVNTVRGPGTVCPAANAEYFGGFNGREHPTNFNGQTVIMKASTDVIPGKTYHMKLVVADQGNNLYDSAIFFGGGSFKIEENLGTPRLISEGNALCQNETLILTATNPSAVSYEWFKDGVPQPLGTNPDQFQITTNQSATYSVRIGLGGTCFSTGDIRIEYVPAITLSNTTLVQCDENNDGLALFNLNQANPQVTAGNTGLSTPVYFKTLADATANIDPITNPTAFENTILSVFARAENQQGCFGIAEITLAVSNNTIANPLDLEECDDKDINPNDGFAIFKLTDREAAILINLPGGTVNYYTSYDDALSGLNPIQDANSFENTIAFEQTIYAKLSSGLDCFGIAEFKIIVHSFGASLQNENKIVCEGSTTLLNAGSGFSSYTWNTTPPQFTQNIRVSSAGTYSVTVTNSNGCEGNKTFFVKASNKATITSVTVNDLNGGNNSITINIAPQSIGDYEYSIDGINFQNSPTFSNLKSGGYIAYVVDKNFCGGATPFSFFVMDYPKFFSPNGDGRNDIWNVPYLNSQPNATVAIFDRYGKLVYFFRGNQPGWNGTFDGQTLPASDYWFKITLQNGREIRGHFSLIR